MNFKEATDILMAPCGLSHLARALGVSEATVRQARLPEGAKARRNPPKGWEDALASLARERKEALQPVSALGLTERIMAEHRAREARAQAILGGVDGEAVAQREQGQELAAQSQGGAGTGAQVVHEPRNAGGVLARGGSRGRKATAQDPRPTPQVREPAPGEQAPAHSGAAPVESRSEHAYVVTPRQPRVQGPITKADTTRRKGK